MRAAERARLKEHVAECSSCAEAYGTALRSAARAGASQRERRLSEQKRIRRETHREMALSATGHRPKVGLHRLRLVILPGLFALLVIAINSVDRSPPPIEVFWEQGEVRAAGHLLDADDRSAQVRAGSWCSTGEDSAARIELDGSRVSLGSGSSVRVERLQGGARVRFHSGSIVLDGAISVSTHLGVFEFAAGAAGRLGLRGGELEVTCERGTVVCTGPRGEERLDAGAARTFSLLAGAPRGEVRR